MQAFYVKENFSRKFIIVLHKLVYLLDSLVRLWSDDELLGWPHTR